MKIQMTDVQVSKLNRRSRKKPIAKFKLEKFDNEYLVSKEVLMSAKDKTWTPSEVLEGMLEISDMKSADGTDLVPCLLGGVGIGKSSLVEQYAKTLANGRKLVYGKINPSEDEFSLIDLRIET